MEPITEDSLLGGRLIIRQHRKGYRFSLDAPLLADFCRVAPGSTVVDLGAGSGVVSLLLGRRLGRGRILAVEIQPALAELARQNVAQNPSSVEIRVVEQDWTSLKKNRLFSFGDRGVVDLVVCNPPYREIGSGRVNPNQEEAVARHEISGSLSTAARAGALLLDPGGIMAAVYPAARLVDMLEALRSAGLEPKRLRMVHSREGERARLALVEAVSGSGKELHVEAPLYIYRRDGEYTEEARAILYGRNLDGIEEGPLSP